MAHVTRKPLFEKRHYEAVAEVMNRSAPSMDDYHTALIYWHLTLERLERLFEKDNPNFNCTKFREACNVAVRDR